ncbi:MAG: 23S rRNA (adenine(2503)-C(2))-methyltransferase RlmN [Holosporales bacterium]|jgi:23S rRNA (adenine2503-C2)-methyltransferase|nr:23S rRNA (adenine(2503)-C(2))-methyltransferase RlmN [Holosporales bacterium]
MIATTPPTQKPNSCKDGILNYSADELEAKFAEEGIPKFRASQVLVWLYRFGKTSFYDMTNIGTDLQKRLDEMFYIYRPQIIATAESADGTVKFLLEMSDRAMIECVYIPDIKRNTVCVSSQVGCAVGCKFCKTGDAGFTRDLLTEEIVSQLLVVRDYIGHQRKPSESELLPGDSQCIEGTGSTQQEADCGLQLKPSESGLLLGDTERRSGVYIGVHEHSSTGSTQQETDYGGLSEGKSTLTNVVFMGMGEPLLNYPNVLRAMRNMMLDEKVGLSRRKITVSTAGISPVIKQIAKDLPCRLAVSLHAPTDEIRSSIMPINNTYSIESILAACSEYHSHHKFLKITFEYLLLDGINDSKECAMSLLKLLKPLHSKVNILRFNSWDGCGFRASPSTKVQSFTRILSTGGLEVSIRSKRGADIMAACGQLSSNAGDCTVIQSRT